ncbi:hypothetical protein K458DRAFT_423848 [Lentithecium fluviatile CBS 122367]|uniref:Uncharacterized protein n=1 Tax=Lentithecium fluviatile CBS 122367 TaxID=1168545 RepID=A0A6G1IHA5_9PLEO|nr:hypothetical protein K458DRAFT_423848 [Lentithecium fluviatile CBS 122367]
MPELSDIKYSRTATIAAVREYYAFLTKMYLDEDEVVHPPWRGWSSITTDALEDLGKTKEVVSLLRHLPYIRARNDGDNAHGAPNCTFADWDSESRSLSLDQIDAEDVRIAAEGVYYPADIPAHVVSLTSGEHNNPIFLLDTNLGIVYWLECGAEIKHNSARECVQDDPWEYAPGNEAKWRAKGAAWAIPAFFEVLEDQFRELNFVPINSRVVLDVYSSYGPRSEGMLAMLQDIYREHGWPDLSKYDKKECLAAVQMALRQRYPEWAGNRDNLASLGSGGLEDWGGY